MSKAQLRFKLAPPKQGHGGKRKGAGRPNHSGTHAHTRRPRLDSRTPLHVTLKLRDGLPSLRRKVIFGFLRKAVAKARVQGLHVVHYAILSNHVHLLVEPQGRSLRRPMQSLLISFSKLLNSELDREGAVFHGRYHLNELKTPTQVRNALQYVLTNEAHHLGKAPDFVRVDAFSSAHAFKDWKTLLPKRRLIRAPRSSEPPLYTSRAATWLLAKGWARGLSERR